MDENIVVTVSGDIEQIAELLRAAGMTVEQVLGAVGIITGSVDSLQRDSLTAIPGVVAVEVEQRFQLPPPDAEIQ
jgi:hypothetical protein